MLTIDEVERIATLARLALSDDEKARFAHQLSDILDHANRLAAVNVEGVAPTASMVAAHDVMRAADDVQPSLTRADALANAPRTDGQFFIVPAALTGDGG